MHARPLRIEPDPVRHRATSSSENTLDLVATTAEFILLKVILPLL